ncbi:MULTISPECIES: YitT family protein [Peptoniphilus]|uniref:YitT family protein n=1 Tax=Peptoniphilus TaxID=162289 RepID=UPI0001DA9F62|nr:MULTISPECIES: YitT family protein [Peptoniphilus]EFI41561.1 hypothetical protein HMPREF0629_00183 [Peptoniphilus sp. oral taxon 386 str. F0131]
MKFNLSLNISKEIFIKKLFSVIFGTFASSIALVYILKPNGMISGGISGLSVLIENVTGIPLGLLVFLLNLPIMILGLFLLSREFMFFSVVSIFLLSIYISLLEKINPNYILTENIILACVYGGVINGIGGGITFRNGTSTGGFDIIAAILKKYFNISIGSVLMMLNIVIIGISSFVYSTDKALFTLISLFICYQVIDKIQLGVGKQKQVFIISNNHEQITRTIQSQLDRGVTYINGKGAYSSNEITIIYLICSSRQIVKVKNIVKELDPKAFMAVSDTAEIQGSGFKTIEI